MEVSSIISFVSIFHEAQFLTVICFVYIFYVVLVSSDNLSSSGFTSNLYCVPILSDSIDNSLIQMFY